MRICRGVTATLVSVLLAACGGNSPAPAPGSTTAPSGLAYSANPAIYAVATAIPANTPRSSGDAVVSYSVTPALPAGLSLNATSGVISGTPTSIVAATSHAVTATNSGGSATVDLSVAVGATPISPSGLTYSENPAGYTLGTAIAANTPSIGGGAVTSYSVAPALPAGLSLNASTGIISGTPTAAAAAAPYTVTATNSAGSAQVALSVTVTADTTAPTVSGTNPASGATGVPINARVTATFSEAMSPASLTGATFVVTQGAGAAPVGGTVSYGTQGTTATFTPTSPLAANTDFTATIKTGAKDLAGNALASAFTWTFNTSAATALGPAPVGLGTAGNYVVLAKTGISTVPPSVLTGDIAVSPITATAITGFSLVADSTNVFSKSTQVTGKVFAANYFAPTESNLTTAVLNMQAAYTDAAGRPPPNTLELGTGNIGGKTLAPGLYKWAGTVTIPADVVLDGGANDVWIFQIAGNLTMAAAKQVTLSGGALAKNVFWQVAGKATFGAGAHFEGVVLAKTDITLETGATMNGRALSQTQVVLDKATITQPAP